MPLLPEIDLDINIDHVIRAQGADPEIIQGRNPRLVKAATTALEMGYPLLEPLVLYEEYKIDSLRHETLKFVEGGALKGKLVAQHLSSAKSVIIILCTVGIKLEKESIGLISSDPVAGLALEGVGSAAVEILANSACNHFEQMAAKKNMGTTIPLSPGMMGWPVDQGQTQIFSLLDAEQIDVRLTTSYLMLPRKSLTFAIGIGVNILDEGTSCDYCNMKETCRYQDHYKVLTSKS